MGGVGAASGNRFGPLRPNAMRRTMAMAILRRVGCWPRRYWAKWPTMTSPLELGSTPPGVTDHAHDFVGVLLAADFDVVRRDAVGRTTAGQAERKPQPVGRSAEHRRSPC